jgi:hypothetical protein
VFYNLSSPHLYVPMAMEGRGNGHANDLILHSYAGYTPTATLDVCKVYADDLEYTEGGRRRISNAVTAGIFLATCLHLRRRPGVRRRLPSAYGLLRRRQPYADGLLRGLFWRRPTPTAPTFGRRRRCRPSASFFIPVVGPPKTYSISYPIWL